MNRKYKVNSINVITLALVCILLLTCIVGTLANQKTPLTSNGGFVPMETRDPGTSNDALATANDKHDVANSEFKPDELLIKFKTASASSINNVIEGLNARILNVRNPVSIMW